MEQVARVQNADRMMISVEPSRRGLNVCFADGFVTSVPWVSVRGVRGLSDVDCIELNPYEVLIRTKHGEVVEIPWDVVRNVGDHDYRTQVEAIALEGQRKFGERLSGLRRRSGLSQRKLAELSGVGRVTIARLESASQSPRLETIQRLATAMGRPIQGLVMDD